jgi:tRNA modification GTPase
VGSGLSPAQRGIVRISGRGTAEILARLTGTTLPPGPARVLQRCVDLGWNQRRLDLSIWYWPDDRSYTGEPCAELHMLGALPLVESLTERLIALGASPAQRGEFTLRSFLAGKMDLPQAEAVLGVIEANTPLELSEALQQLAGNLSHPVRELRTRLIELTAHLEAGLDFVEEDIEFISNQQLTEGLQRIVQELEVIDQQLRNRSARSRTPTLVLVGLPNSGKSSLFNALCGTERAIVSSEAGTTRDAVSMTIYLSELPVELIDTAGLEELQSNTPRALAQDVLDARLRRADVALLCIDVHHPPPLDWLHEQRARLQSLVAEVRVIGTKADLPYDPGVAKLCSILVSPYLAASLVDLREQLARVLRDCRQTLHCDALHATAIRCRGSLEPAQHSVSQALQLAAHGGGEELIATELREAIDALSAVIGEVHSDDILGEIFGRFCIGK